MTLTAEGWRHRETPRVAVMGATGYVGSELCRLLWSHPGVELAFAGSSSAAGRQLADCVDGMPPIPLSAPEELTPDRIDLAFLALPPGRASTVAGSLVSSGCRVIDMSGDHRLKDRQLHEDVYGTPRDERLAGTALYGITEFARPLLKECWFVANPGCYATSVSLALGPLARTLRSRGGLRDCFVSSQSGVSGAGREPTDTTHFCRVDGDVRPYKVGEHRHAPEMAQFLDAVGDSAPVDLVFVPHLVPIRRGIVSTIFLGTPLPAAEVRSQLSESYESAPFVEVLPEGDTAGVRAVEQTNSCHLSVHAVKGSERVVIVSAIDNLLKGAAGQAIQNMNVALSLEETMGLPHVSAMQTLPSRAADATTKATAEAEERRPATWVAN